MDQQCGTEVLRIYGGGRIYLLTEDVWIGGDGGDEGWFISLEEGVYDQNSVDIDSETILLQSIGFVEAEEGILYQEKIVWVLASGLQPEV